MEHPQTPALRPVNRKVQEALGEMPTGPFNFGLYFNKWFYVVHGGTLPRDRWKRITPWACTMVDETKVADKGDFCRPNYLLDNFDVSLALFNGSRTYRRPLPVEARGRYKEELKEKSLPFAWDRRDAEDNLKKKHHGLDAAAQAMEKLGYKYLAPEEVPLLTPLILGLGDEHPTEKGFRFDWTLGLPYIPASSLKGVLRLAWLVQQLRQRPTEDAARALAAIIMERPEQIEGIREIFGAGGDQAHRGRVIFLDAYPKELPRLKAEIMTCHYRDYYEGKRGPTEDQQPNPQKFWAVAPFLDEAGRQPLTFVFRLLLAPEIAADETRQAALLQAFREALTEHGLGAKTAIGHGRFSFSGTPLAIAETEKEETPGKEPPKPPPPAEEIWERAKLSYEPDKGRITATSPQGKKAFGKGRELVPKALHKKLFKDKKSVTVLVVVDAAEFRIIKIEGE